MTGSVLLEIASGIGAEVTLIVWSDGQSSRERPTAGEVVEISITPEFFETIEEIGSTASSDSRDVCRF